MSDNVFRIVTIRHWLPIFTFCPYNNLPDLIWISVTFTGDEFVELYNVRKTLREAFTFRTIYMEDIAKKTLAMFPEATNVTVRLGFSRHEVKIVKAGE